MSTNTKALIDKWIKVTAKEIAIRNDKMFVKAWLDSVRRDADEN